ncbi:heme/hemin ABC transporter substrate-binding protein [Hyphomicrobium sp. DMF-1]|jgi:iron complex transport system substrate-binding protein|uniref:heme/hemin ABC transporter substrate-binding protein n=1 Tax=Hyphomicrobium sp. DMF-1 TaxID=3019544 RepID=UPI0022EBEF3F|nr:ABC transporter substrate-binding protein [Hyphomicrobium sp. DMF-1]WBT37178.1 ABC transporter substrate-binding protein [Hyphomicrobium sp. DMF-1]
MFALLKRVRRFLWIAGIGSLAVCGAQLAPKAHAETPKAAGEQRIVSIGGDVTEIIFALGRGDSIVAVDTTSHYPPDAVATKESVGYMRALSTEGVLSMSPTLIIASGNAGPPEVVAALKASSIPMIEISTPETPDGVAQKIGAVADALGLKEEGAKLASRVKAEFDAVAAKRAKVTKPVRALFVLANQGGRVVVGGTKTSAEAIFGLAGAENAVKSLEGYKPLNDEAAVTAAPDIIVVMLRSDGANKGEMGKEIGSMKGLGSTPAAKAGRIIEVDGSYALQFGPRAAAAASDLMDRFYPELAQKPATAERP